MHHAFGINSVADIEWLHLANNRILFNIIYICLFNNWKKSFKHLQTRINFEKWSELKKKDTQFCFFVKWPLNNNLKIWCRILRELCRDEPWHDPTRSILLTRSKKEANLSLTRILFDPRRFFWPEWEKMKNLVFLGKIFQTQTQMKYCWKFFDPVSSLQMQINITLTEVAKLIFCNLRLKNFWQGRDWTDNLRSQFSVAAKPTMLRNPWVLETPIYIDKQFEFSMVLTGLWRKQI